MNYVTKGIALALIFMALGSSAMAVTNSIYSSSVAGSTGTSLTMNEASSGKQSIVATTNALSSTVATTGPYTAFNYVGNTEGDYASFYTEVDPLDIATPETGTLTVTNSITPKSVSYTSSFDVKNANTATNSVYAWNAEGDNAAAAVNVQDLSGTYRASISKSWGQSYASSNAAFAYMQADQLQGDWANADTYSWVNGMLGSGTGSNVHVGDGTTYGFPSTLPSINDYQSFTQTTNGAEGVTEINKATIDAHILDIVFGSYAAGSASVYGTNTLGYSGSQVFLPEEGALSVDTNNVAFGYFDAKNTVSYLGATVGGTSMPGDQASMAQSGSTSGPDNTPAVQQKGKGSGTYDYTAFAYSGLTDGSGGAKVTVTAI